MVTGSHIDSKLYDTLEENEVFATFAKVYRGLYNRERFGAPPSDYVVRYEGHDPALTIYEGDHIAIYMGVYDTVTGEVSGFGLGQDEDGWLKVSGLDGDDIGKVSRAPYAWWTEVSNTGGIVEGTFDQTRSTEDNALQGVFIETGAVERYVDEVGIITGNGSVTEDVQTLTVAGSLDNPWYNWSTGEDGDLLVSIGFGMKINYVDYADGLVGEDVFDDEIFGAKGRDKLKGGQGDDLIEGRGGKDTLIGKGGDDDLYGQGGKDKLKGQAGDDALYGGKGNDKLIGGGGDDLIEGGKGRDMIKGGGGADVFVFDDKAGVTLVKDFASGEDSIQITEGAYVFSLLDIDDGDKGAEISWGDSLVILKGVDADDLVPGDFLFGA